MSIAALDVCKRFGAYNALDHVTVEAPSGELLALLGPSGSGKTTLLRIIAGLEVPDSGSIRYADEEVTNASARDRGVGFVFQHYALFRHMTVFENVAFGLRVRKWPEQKVRNRVMELLELVRLQELAHRYPSQLSGGQKQRIALVRSLAPQPKVLLLDEPFGALDAKVRLELRGWLRRFHDELHVTSIFVTHDQEEAFEVADRIVIMNRGRVEQSGTPAEVFEHPANAFVMDFLGNVNIFPSHLFGEAHPALASSNGNGSHRDSGSLQLYVRPHELSIHRGPVNGGSLPARIVHINPAGSVVKVRLVAESFGLVVNVDVERDRFVELGLMTGENVHISPRKVRAFTPDYAI
ncbi:sulfate/molybdate ABC transporter ATP-binding protein [Tuwongella immobilis]|uniref:ABC transporter domain-containing protein n=1 Tax=Tuwongella immobilis TaxID=692036 RepID=A0A6C2YSN5_9BACT|nr:TOBE-like domain-containing protein [Tuwongella immobilis]VIP04391.1 sulfate abc atp-binding protein : Sulfate/thiosulfate import ATP-binding protein CysA OS=Planctomyces limnophilus (strain ATCC 43296 / DSM 3776 / IFAM 1008 / 290) GN=cysA PE=3 SV=1: ABC_tran: TOBE [Tuwongella immobilis]VTS06144.1 sulfate abc atp-binding protein : Sulfate/thiosulfate import ATP-binding protein CysA OS=Planctomyces limnophilus (strain ATCC 43296 / DSM 3776 / IFAM 1008 / 290) GN=cysA PE=3 SV=1: ABC_tran: TOBE [T